MRHLPKIGAAADWLPSDPWDAVRRPARHHDDALTGTAHGWLRRLPAGRRPVQLCMQYPRVANLVAWHWGDADKTRELLYDLLTDRRGGRTGFPKSVALELRRLRDLNDNRALAEPEAAAFGWLRRIWPRH